MNQKKTKFTKLFVVLKVAALPTSIDTLEKGCKMLLSH